MKHSTEAERLEGWKLQAAQPAAASSNLDDLSDIRSSEFKNFAVASAGLSCFSLISVSSPKDVPKNATNNFLKTWCIFDWL